MTIVYFSEKAFPMNRYRPIPTYFRCIAEFGKQVLKPDGAGCLVRTVSGGFDR